MLTHISPKLPMRNKNKTRDFYINKLNFQEFGKTDFENFLLVKKDNIQIHFFEFKNLNPDENFSQVYIRVDNIGSYYQTLLDNKTFIHPNGLLQNKLGGQKEFSVFDPDNNLLTFGQDI